MRTPARILVVDDNPANVDILCARLTAHGYEMVTAADGEEALVAVRTQQPDLILLDVMMPKLDGIEVCRRTRHCRSFRSFWSQRKRSRRTWWQRSRPGATST
jgi:CheY-like chemotaxis protein